MKICISSTQPKDIYDISLYRYDGKALCEELVNGDLDPLSIGSLENGNSECPDKGHEQVAITENSLEKGGTYYVSVLHVGGSGCGHIATFSSKGKQVEVQAKAKECFKIPEPKKGDSTPPEAKKVRVRTRLLDSSDHKPISGELMITDRESGKKRIIRLKEDSATSLSLSPDVTYRFKGKALGYHDKSVEKGFDSDTSFSLLLKSLEKGEKIVLSRIYFHPNTYAFRDQSQSALNALYRYMKKRDKARIEIQGHTASDRNIEEVNPLYRSKGPAWNFTGSAQELSLLRAKAVKKELVSRGIEAERMKTKGFGGSRKLVKDPQSQKEEQKNMRVEVRILK
ncbi:MAG: OmpA family protein [Flavobacteriales bacterium]